MRYAAVTAISLLLPPGGVSRDEPPSLLKRGKENNDSFNVESQRDPCGRTPRPKSGKHLGCLPGCPDN